MSSIVILNGIPYIIPDTGEVGWGQEVHNYLVALGSGGVLSLEGGDFTLQNEVNFGPNYGIASAYYRSGLDPAADAGVFRMTNTEAIMWRNVTNTGNLPLYVVGDVLYFNGTPVGSGSGGGSPLTTKGDLYTFSTLNTRLPVGLNGTVLVADSSSPTGLSWNAVSGVSGSVTGFTFTNANGILGTVGTPTTTPNLTLSLGAITPTSVTASGPITGSNFTGSVSGTNTGDQTIVLTGAISGTGTGAITTTFSGTTPIANGGTGQTTPNNAFNALVPSQAGQSGRFLSTNGTNTFWQVAGGGGIGSVTNVAINASNGLSGSVANPTTTPVINVSLNDTTVAPGPYTSANIVVDSTGRITSATNGTIPDEFFTAYTLNGTPVTLPDSSNNSIVVNGVTANTTVTLPNSINTATIRTMMWFLPPSNFNISFVGQGGFSVTWENGLNPTLSPSTSTLVMLSQVPPSNKWYGVISYGYP